MEAEHAQGLLDDIEGVIKGYRDKEIWFVQRQIKKLLDDLAALRAENERLQGMCQRAIRICEDQARKCRPYSTKRAYWETERDYFRIELEADDGSE